MEPDDGRSFRTVHVSLLFLTMILIKPSHGVSSELISSHQPIVALAGDDVILPCQLQPAVSVSSETLLWIRPDLDQKYIHVHEDGRLMFQSQNPSYYLRTALFVDQLVNGNVSLKLFRVKLSDEGRYTCIIDSKQMEASVQLTVGAASSPVVNIADRIRGGVVLQCESAGWYPEPEMFWLDGEGNLLSAGPTETVRGPDDLYTVSSRVTVEKRHSNSFTCRVQQNHINQTRETHIQVSDELFLVESSSALRISICLTVCLLAVAAVVCVVWKWGRNKTETQTNSHELQLLMEEDRQRLQLMTAKERIKYLEKTKVKLDEDLQKTEGELEDVKLVITTLIEQKENLKDQREKLTSLQQEDNIKIKEKKKKKKKSKLSNLEDTMGKHEELSMNINSLLEKTESLILKMTERKTNLERDKKQIDENLKENKRQREETERKLQSEREKETNQPSSV